MGNGYNKSELQKKMSELQIEYKNDKDKVDEYVQILEVQQKKFTIFLTISLICLLVNNLIINTMVESSGGVKEMGYALRPIFFISFVVLFIIAVSKGFDLFLHSRFDWARKLADRIQVVSISSKIEELNISMNKIKEEMDKCENQIFTIEQENELNEMVFGQI